MRVKCIINYNDLQLKRLVKAGEEIEVTDARAKELAYHNVAEAIDEPTTPEVATKPAPKKATTRKKKVEG